MEDTAVARRYARTAVTTYVPEGTRPEQSRILRAAAMLTLATGIGVTLVSGHGPDLSQVFGAPRTNHGWPGKTDRPTTTAATCSRSAYR